MKEKQTLSLAYSSCPNDTFIFHAMAHNMVKNDALDFQIILADVETLNQAAAKQQYDVTKLSFAALGSLRESYALLRSGAALGRGCGPLIIHRPQETPFQSKHPRIAVPGLGTTAFLLARFYFQALYPLIEPEFIPMPFENIMPLVLSSGADTGVIIHEGRFVYKNMGLECLCDLGQWWESETGLPIPLGCIAVKRNLGSGTALMIEQLIRKSILFAHANPQKGISYIKAHAQELDDQVIQEHIQLYVNDFSLDIGTEGEAAIRAFFKKAEQAGLIPESETPLFATTDPAPISKKYD